MDFTQGNILKKLLAFMIPVLGALILQAMYGAVDLLMVGWFGTTAGISGVSTGSNIVNLVVFVVTGLSMGITVLISRYIGEGHNNRIGKVLGGAVVFFICLGIGFSILLLVFARQFATLMQAPEEALGLTTLYVRICGGGILFVIAYNVISAIFRGIGDSNSPLMFVGIACVVNILADYVFVALMGLNVAGAAMATILAQATSVVLSLLIIRRKTLPFEFHLSDIGFNSEIPVFLKLGFPIALQELLTNISFLALCAFVNRLGLDASSGYGVAQKLVQFIMLVPTSLMQSNSSFVSQNVGARKERRALHAMYTGMVIGVVIGVFIFIAIQLKGDLLSSIFTSDEAVIAKSYEYLRGFALEAIMTSFLFNFQGYFSGHGKTLFVMVQGLIQSFGVRLPMSYIMSIQPNASLVYIGMAAPTATTVGVILCLIYFLKMKKVFLSNEAAD